MEIKIGRLTLIVLPFGFYKNQEHQSYTMNNPCYYLFGELIIKNHRNPRFFKQSSNALGGGLKYMFLYPKLETIPI